MKKTMGYQLGMIPTDFAMHYVNNCGMTLSQVLNLWISGGEGRGWKVGKFIISLYVKEHGVPPNSYEQEYHYALTKRHLLETMSWEDLEAATIVA